MRHVLAWVPAWRLRGVAAPERHAARGTAAAKAPLVAAKAPAAAAKAPAAAAAATTKATAAATTKAIKAHVTAKLARLRQCAQRRAMADGARGDGAARGGKCVCDGARAKRKRVARTKNCALGCV